MPTHQTSNEHSTPIDQCRPGHRYRRARAPGYGSTHSQSNCYLECTSSSRMVNSPSPLSSSKFVCCPSDYYLNERLLLCALREPASEQPVGQLSYQQQVYEHTIQSVRLANRSPPINRALSTRRSDDSLSCDHGYYMANELDPRTYYFCVNDEHYELRLCPGKLEWNDKLKICFDMTLFNPNFGRKRTRTKVHSEKVCVLPFDCIDLRTH